MDGWTRSTPSSKPPRYLIVTDAILLIRFKKSALNAQMGDVANILGSHIAAASGAGGSDTHSGPFRRRQSTNLETGQEKGQGSNFTQRGKKKKISREVSALLGPNEPIEILPVVVSYFVQILIIFVALTSIYLDTHLCISL